MPPAPPVRAAPADYHYHAYDYAQAPLAPAPAAWTPSQGVATAGGAQFYSLLLDLAALQTWGAANGVPNIAEAAIGQSGQGRDIRMMSFGNAANNPAAPAVVITGGIHAREWIGAEFVYLLAEYLVMHYRAAAGNRYQRAIRQLVNSRRIHIIPMLNPDGNHFTVFDPAPNHRLWRKNRRDLPNTNAGWLAELTNGAVPPAPNPPFANVTVRPAAPGYVTYDAPQYDPARGIPPGGPAALQAFTIGPDMRGIDANRNFATTAFGYATQDRAGDYTGGGAHADGYFGTRAGGEAESGVVTAALAGINAIAASIDYHAYGKVILYPSEAFNTGAIGADYRGLGKALKQLVHAAYVRDYRLGSARELIGYDAVGSIMDYLAEHRQSRAFTIELDPRYDPNDAQAVAQQKFVLPENQISYVFEKNIRGVLALLAAPARPATAAQATAQAGQMGNTALGFLTWNVYGRGNRLPLLPV